LSSVLWVGRQEGHMACQNTIPAVSEYLLTDLWAPPPSSGDRGNQPLERSLCVKCRC